MKEQKESLFLRFLYHTAVGRFLLKLLSSRFVSRMAGLFLSSPFSRFLIKGFIKKNHIPMEEYEDEKCKSFNAFFSRKIKKEYRPIEKSENILISPSDGFVSVYPIKEGLVLPIKQSVFDIPSLLQNEKLASKYQNGTCVVLRLCVEHYHRYCYLDEGTKEKNIYIPGKLHTVRPIALEKIPVFMENAREYTTLHTKNFKDVVQIEIGALLVGKIKNYHEEHHFLKGEEKGTFLFGGSTIVLLFQEKTIEISKKMEEASKKGLETAVKMGEEIGKKIK